MLMNYANKKIKVSADSLANGGAERVACNLANELSIKKDVEFIAFENTVHYTLNDKIKLIVNDKKIGNKVVKLIYYPFFAGMHLSANDTVISNMIRPNLVFALLKYLINFRLICIHHSSFRRIKSPLGRLIVKFFYKKADVVVCISLDMLQDYNNIMGNANGVLIHNPHELSRIEELAKDDDVVNQFQNLINIEKAKTDYFVMVGRLIPLKKIETLIDAFEYGVPDKIKVLIIGKGDEAYTKQLKESIRNKGLNNQIIFLGHMNNPFPLIAKSNGIILCSESEGFPNILVESLCLGVPVIATDCVSGPREILCAEGDIPKHGYIKTSYGILIPVNDSISLSKAINDITSFKDKYDKKALRRRVSEFDIKKIVEKYYKIIDTKIPS